MDRYVPLPPLPGRIGRLNELAYDLWWSWNPRAREVFRDLDYPLWRFTDHNPVLLLHLLEPDRLDQAASDPTFLRIYDEAVAGLDTVRAGAGTWWLEKTGGKVAPIAWITPEFALHQSLPMDASATGMLAGDFCKEASDLGLPLVGVGLMYPQGYAHQRLSAEGWQQEAYEYIDWSDAPIVPALCADGSPCQFEVPVDGAAVQVAVWQVRLGRVSIYLLDTNLPVNTPWDRELSSKTFPDDPEACLRQAVLLGAGAVRALERLGIEPSAWHVAEGAGALVALERLDRLVSKGMSFDDARGVVAQSTVFGTRDAAPPAHGTFSFSSVDRQLTSTWPSLRAHRTAVLRLGELATDRGAGFNTSVLGARVASAINVPATAAVASAGAAWHTLRAGAGVPVREPLSIPAGVHLASWVSADLARLFDEYIGDDWRERQDDAGVWRGVAHIPAVSAWEVRQRLRGYLVDFIRERARRKWSREQASGNRLVALGTLLDARTLTIGFARRFTGGARPELVFHDVDRLARIVSAERRPVQIVFAGRAHPGDEAGKHHLQRVFRHALDPVFGGRIAFLEDYDLHAARLLAQGCDVWLSTPRKGSPGSMGALKAAVNGAANLATADAWWSGGCTGANGWVIDGGHANDPVAQDAADASALYRLLEEEIVPAFYERDRSGVPGRWSTISKAAIAAAVPGCGARHTVKAFAGLLYLPESVPR